MENYSNPNFHMAKQRKQRRRLWPVYLTFWLHVAGCAAWVVAMILVPMRDWGFEGGLMVLLVWILGAGALLFTGALTTLWAVPFFGGKGWFRIGYGIHHALEGGLLLLGLARAGFRDFVAWIHLPVLVVGLLCLLNVVYIFVSKKARAFGDGPAAQRGLQ